MTSLSQRDPRWANIKVGTSNSTIGQIGCTITSLAMIIGTTPDVVNQKLNALPKWTDGSTGYKDGCLVIWSRISEAFPGITCSRVWAYNNEDVVANVPVIVQVDGAPIGGSIHFVTFIGNHQLVDPWDGQTKATSTYTPTNGYAIIKGTWQQARENVSIAKTSDSENYFIDSSGNYKIDYNNKDSIKALFDYWVRGQRGELVDKAQFETQLAATNSCQSQLQTASETNNTLQKQLDDQIAKTNDVQNKLDDLKSKYDEEVAKNIDLNAANAKISGENQDNGQKAFDNGKLADELTKKTDMLADAVNPDLKKSIKNPVELADLVAREVVAMQDELEQARKNEPNVYSETLTKIVNHLIENGKLNDFLRAKGMEIVTTLEDPKLYEKYKAYTDELLSEVKLGDTSSVPGETVIANPDSMKGEGKKNFLNIVFNLLVKPFLKSTDGSQS